MIKFRAWDKKNKRWMTPEIEDSEESEIRLDLWGNVEFTLPWWEQGVDSVYTVDGGSMFDITQSTGLEDVNGVEIYEGDILKNGRGKIGEVIYLQQEVGYVVSLERSDYRLGHRNTGEGYKIANDHTVIGNIYENPGLLEATK